MALHEGIFSGPSHGNLVEITTQGAMSYVSQTFTENDQLKPTGDEEEELGKVLSRQYRSYKNSNPNLKQNKAIPIYVISEFSKKKATETQRGTSQLANGGFFCA